MPPVAEAPTQSPAATLGSIAGAFLKVSLFGFGGGVVWARRLAVEQHDGLSEAEFLDIVSLCQFLRGPNIIGIAVCTGAKLRGVAGALAAVADFLVLPWSSGLAAGVLCLRYAQAPLLRNILGRISAVAAGLLIATGLKLLLPHRELGYSFFILGLLLVRQGNRANSGLLVRPSLFVFPPPAAAANSLLRCFTTARVARR